MTVQPTGYPDFQALPSWRSANIFASFTTNVSPGTEKFSIVSVFNFAAIELLIVSVSQGVSVNLVWSMDAAGTEIISLDQWYVGIHTSLHTIVPCRANYVACWITNPGGAAVNIKTFMAACNTPVTRPHYPVTFDNIGQYGTVLGAGVQSIIYRNWIHAGHGHVTVTPADATGKLNFELATEDELTNKVKQLWTSVGPVAQVHFDFPWPDEIVSLTITNTDGTAAHDCDYAVWSTDY